MAIKDVLAAEIEDAGTDETGSASGSDERRARPELSPFSMEYDVEAYSVESDDLNNALTALVAVTNLL